MSADERRDELASIVADALIGKPLAGSHERVADAFLSSAWLARVKREAAADALEEAADAQSSSFGHSGPYWSPWWLRTRAAAIREEATR